MRKLNVILNDYPSETKVIIGFNADDFDAVDAVWEQPDEPNLKRIQALPRFSNSFSGYHRFADLLPEHFRMLIIEMLQVVNKLPEPDRQDSNKPEVGMLSFLILAYVRCLEIRTGSTMESFKINVISPLNISYEFSAEVEIALDEPKAKPPTEFSIIVDNSDEE